MGIAQTIARPATPPNARSEASPAASESSRWASPLALGLVGHLFWWLALPPVGWAPLALLAPVSWAMLIQRANLAGRRPYLALWFSSFVFWLSALYWLTLPHWATSFGWVALSFYLALYFPLFIALCRVAVHACRISLLVAAPVVWVGLELSRAHLLSGFAMGSLAHTQYRWPELLQLSDALGAYGVSGLIILLGACVARIVSRGSARRAWWPLLPAAAVCGGALWYSHFRITQQAFEPGPKVALIQGSIDIELKYDPSERHRIFKEYFGLSRQAVDENEGLDLIVWPETMFRDPWYLFDPGFEPPSDHDRTPEEIASESRRALQLTVKPLDTPCLIGIDTLHFKVDDKLHFSSDYLMDHYNTALWVDREGAVQGRYDKCHLVAFGEYVPFAETIPWLYQLTPLPGGSKAGAGPQSFQIGSFRYAPNICYENTISHLIRAQVNQLSDEQREPEVLVNLTNDGWFWGSSELDLHLACAVFRAIECRKPFLIAANTGFSAWIDSNGRIRAQGPRRATGVIVAQVEIDRRHSWYLAHGDLPAAGCLLACGVLAIVGIGRNWRTPRPAAQLNADGQ